MSNFKIKSFCKINLSLRVLNKLKNGYHNIKSLITFCGLHDVLSVSKINESKDKVFFFGKFKNNIDIKSNTITKTLYMLRKKRFLEKNYFKINIQKNIPHGSGLGSGSSNAAALLDFFKKKMKLKINKKMINRIAKEVGSDVPIILEKKNTLLTGEKNKILRLNVKFRLNILIVYPNIICKTKKIYEKNKKFSSKKCEPKINFRRKSKLISYLINEKNDLEKTVVKYYPRVGKIINFLNAQKGCYFARITGSGSACIGIFSNMKAAVYTQNLLKKKFPKYWCVVSKTI